MLTNNMYDFIIVGAGIAGMYTAYKLHIKYPDARICIIESSMRIGGRINTVTYDDVKMESGAGRFSEKQYRILSLIKELNLNSKIVPLSNDGIKYMPINPSYDKKLETIFPSIDSFIDYIKKYIKKNKISDKDLINTTIIDFINTNFSKTYPTLGQYIIDLYPYYSELAVLNALEGINLFSNEFNEDTKYFILNGGLHQLIEELYFRLTNTKLKYSKYRSLKQKIVKNGNNKLVDIFTQKRIKDITFNKDTKTYNVSYDIYDTKLKKNIKLQTNNIILAIPQKSLLQIKYISKHKDIFNNLNSIKTEPLFRIYARYPLDAKTGKVWFDGLNKISTNLYIKYIIPINSEKGVIMISYTDSKYANYWFNKLEISEDTLIDNLNNQLSQLFPDITIPKALWYKYYYWDMGAGYWKPKYDRKTIMKQLIKPINNENIYICGENYSSHQAWIEGALETSDMVINEVFDSFLKKSRAKNIFTHKEVFAKTSPKAFIHKEVFAKTSPKAFIHKEVFAKTSPKAFIHKEVFAKTSPKAFTHKEVFAKTSPKAFIHKGSGFNESKKKTKKNISSTTEKTYTLEEVAKHNTKSDAWIVINGKVADITKWIPNHPGGDIIMKGVGKDATKLFNSIGHDDYAKKMLNKYKIGILKK